MVKPVSARQNSGDTRVNSMHTVTVRLTDAFSVNKHARDIGNGVQRAYGMATDHEFRENFPDPHPWS